MLSALGSISAGYPYRNWRRNGQVIEIWDVNWYAKRQARVPKAWIQAMRERFKSKGTLDIDGEK